MLNNKSFKNWTKNDLLTLIQNEDFRESQFLDYKRTFEFLETGDKLQKAKGKDEFRNDVCSFANAKKASLSTEIKRFRAERLSELLEDNTGMFGVIHVIPATFRNPADFISMCDLGKAGLLPIPEQWNAYIRGRMIPNVDGVWFPSEDGLRDFQLLRVFNHGAVELKENLYTTTYKEEEFLVSIEFLNAIGEIIEGIAELYKTLERHPAMYICISIIGCKGYRNYDGRFCADCFGDKFLKRYIRSYGSKERGSFCKNSSGRAAVRNVVPADEMIGTLSKVVKRDYKPAFDWAIYNPEERDFLLKILSKVCSEKNKIKGFMICVLYP